MMRWCRSHRFDPVARELADRHYNRQKPGSPQFVRAGSCLVLLSDCGNAVWVTSRQNVVRHAWPGTWENTLFRSEDAGIASELIRQAVAATLAHYGQPPPLGMITMIDRDEVQPTMVRGKPVWGWSYRKAGFVDAGETEVHRKLVLQLWPADMPAPMPARQRSMLGTPLFPKDENSSRAARIATRTRGTAGLTVNHLRRRQPHPNFEAPASSPPAADIARHQERRRCKERHAVQGRFRECRPPPPGGAPPTRFPAAVSVPTAAVKFLASRPQPPSDAARDSRPPVVIAVHAQQHGGVGVQRVAKALQGFADVG